MGIFDKIKDHFEKADFSVSPQKKLKTISKELLKPTSCLRPPKKAGKQTKE